MKKEWFRRPVRMTHRFGSYEGNDDPFGGGTFEPNFPIEPVQRSRPLEVQKDGLHDYRPTRSPVCKPSGAEASINGPKPDLNDFFGSPIPASVKSRKAP